MSAAGAHDGRSRRRAGCWSGQDELGAGGRELSLEEQAEQRAEVQAWVEQAAGRCWEVGVLARRARDAGSADDQRSDTRASGGLLSGGFVAAASRAAAGARVIRRVAA